MRPADVHRLTVSQATDRYIDLIRAKTLTGALAPGTAEVYTRDVHTFADLAGGERILDDLTGEDVDEVLLAFARKPDGRRTATEDRTPSAGPTQSGASQARFRRSVSAFFRHAAITGWVQLDPMRAATVMPRQRGGLRPERRALTREQAEGLLGTARHLAAAPPDRRKRADQRTELRDALIVLLLTTVGPRVSELTRADVEHFYVGDGVRYWRIFGKGGPTRDVPLPHEVARVLDAYLEQRHARHADTPEDAPDRGALLLSWRGRRLARGDVQAAIDRVLARVDPRHRRGVTPHGLRHTTATHLLAAATDMDAVRRVLGHADLSTLGRYRDELPGELEAAMRAHPLLGGTDTPPA